MIWTSNDVSNTTWDGDEGKNTRWKSSTVFHTWPVACWPHEKRNYFTGCRPVETINSYSTRKYKLKFVAGWPTNKQTQKHKAKRKITKGEDSRVRVHSKPCRKRSAFFGFGSSSLLLRFPYSPCCVARPGSKETVLPVVDLATNEHRFFITPVFIK